MRKVKLLALLLAALMVVAAFAGCANTENIEADIVDLDDRVSALEGKLDEQNGKLDEIQSDLADDTTAEELEKIEAALEEQKQANAELQETIKDLIEKLDKVENETAGDANAEAAAAALQAAVKVYTTKLNEAKISYELARPDYTAEDYAFIVTTISAAISSISSATDEAGVKKIYDDAMAAVNGKSTVLSKLVNYYNAIMNNVTVESEALVNEAYQFVALNGPAAELYYSNGVWANKVTAYETGKIGPDGAPVKVDLVAAINAAKAAHVYVASTNFKKLVDTTNATIAVLKDGVEYVASGNYTTITAAQTAYNNYVAVISGNGTYAAYLSDSLLALVSPAYLEAAKAEMSALVVAAALYNANTFASYKALADKEAYTAKDVYAATDVAVSAWATANNLSDKNVKAIINAKEGVAKFYEQYNVDKAVVAKYVEAYSKLTTLMNRVDALNKITLLTTDNIKAYAQVAADIDAWRDLGKIKDVNNADKAVKINDTTFKAMLVDSKIIDNTVDLEAAAITSAAAYYGLYNFVNAAKLNTATFFGVGGTYLTAKAEAKSIKDAVKALNDVETDKILSNNFNSIEQYIKIKGDYKADANGVYKPVYANKDDTYATGVLTMAAFVEKYTHDGTVAGESVSYCLEFMLDDVAYDSGVKAVSDRLANQAAAFEKLMFNADKKHLVDLIDATTSDKVPSGINLADKATVEAAQTAYDKWVVGGGNSEMRIWTADGTTGNYKFVYIFDQTKLKKLDDANDRMVQLIAKANALVKHFDLLSKVVGVNFDNYATEVANTGKTSDGKKYVVLTDGEVKYEGNKLYTVSLAKSTTEKDSKSGVTVATLMANGEKAYNEFMADNGATYKPVEDALASVFALELIYVKTVVYNNVVKAIGADDADLDTYKNAWIVPAENYVALNNVYVEIYKKELKDLAAIGYGVDRELIHKVDATVFDK